jgi:hypothetical protein
VYGIHVALEIDVLLFQAFSPAVSDLTVEGLSEIHDALLHVERLVVWIGLDVDCDEPADVRNRVVDARHRNDRMYGVVLLVGFHEIVLVEILGDVVEILLALDRKCVQNGHQFARDNIARSLALDGKR